MQMKTALIALSLALVLLASCAPQPRVAPPIVEPELAPVATEQAVSDIEVSVVEIDTLDKELDTSELDELDTELAELDKLDFG